MDATRKYEECNAVDRYVVEGVNIWPFLRTATACYRQNHSAPRRDTSQFAQAKNRLQHFSRSLVEDRARIAKARPDGGEIVFVTQTNRRERIDGVYWHAVADPLALEFERRGVTTLICEAGPAVWPRARPSMWISRRFRFMRSLRTLAPRLQEPEWFQDYAHWAAEFLGHRSHWHEWESHFREMIARARVFEAMFRRMGTKAVFLDCWYTWESFAATLAARRAGVLSIELQHGVQGRHMSGYAGWQRSYELMPELFWVWGRQASDALLERNSFGIRTIVGGNCWLNAWRRLGWADAVANEIGRAKALRGGRSPVVLATLQPGIEREPVLDAIARSPRDWQWLVRIHRRERTTHSYSELTRRLADIQRHVLVDQATEAPLYALMNVIDVHVTGASTCALEALAFGKPTVVFHPNGRDAFGSLLDSNAMAYADRGDAIVDAVERFRTFDPEDARRLANAQYASSDATQAAIDEVLSECQARSRSRAGRR
jgi:hypothetical protein